MEAVVSIFDRNGALAYVMFGQIVPQENCADTLDNSFHSATLVAHFLFLLRYKGVYRKAKRTAN